MASVFREACVRHTDRCGGKDQMRCAFLLLFFFNGASDAIVERSPDCLCADEAGDIGQDGLTN